MDEDRTVRTHKEHTQQAPHTDQHVSAAASNPDVAVAMIDLQTRRALRTLKQDINDLLDRLPDSTTSAEARSLRLELMAELGHKSNHLQDLLRQIRYSDH